MNDQKRAIRQSFDKAADSYDYHAKLQRIVADRLFSFIKNDITNNDMVLDGGCGTGYFHELLRKNKIHCQLIQADISYNMCKKSAEYASPPEYGGTYTINADIESLPIVSDKIDKVFSSMTVQWTKLDNSLSEIYRTLRSGGKLAFSTIGENSLSELAAAFSELDSASHINNFYSEDKVNEVIARSGFKSIAIHTQTVTQNFASVKDIMRSIKGVGANYKSNNGRKFLGKNYFQKLEAIYQEKFGNESGLPLSWNIIYAVATK
jgi:malonyl-CoA O-methyltransferase